MSPPLWAVTIFLKGFNLPWHGEQIVPAGWDGFGLPGANFALVNRPIYTSKGVNTSSAVWLYPDAAGYHQSPANRRILPWLSDTSAPHPRGHIEFPDYKVPAGGDAGGHQLCAGRISAGWAAAL